MGPCHSDSKSKNQPPKDMESRNTDKDILADQMTHSMIIKADKQKVLIVHDMEITLSVGFSSSVDYLLGDFLSNSFDVSCVDSQFLRDRCYTLHSDTFIAVDGGITADQRNQNYSSIFQRATDLKFKKILIKSPNYDLSGPVQRLFKSYQLKVGDEKARHFQLNFLFRLFSNVMKERTKEIIEGIVELTRGYGKINHLMLDCRPLQFNEIFQVLETLTTLGVAVAHEFEILMNFREGDNPEYFQQIFDMVPKLSENIGFDITVVSPSGKPSILKDVANGLEKLANSKCLVNESCLTSFALRFSDTLRVADATSANLGKALTLLIPKILLNPKHAALRSFCIDVSQLSLTQEGYQAILASLEALGNLVNMKTERTKLASMIHVNVANCQLSTQNIQLLFGSLLKIATLSQQTIDQYTVGHLSLNLSGNLIKAEDVASFLPKLVGIAQSASFSLSSVNLNLSKCSIKFGPIFLSLIDVFVRVLQSTKNNVLFQHLVLNLSGNQLHETDDITHFNHMLQGAFECLSQHYKSFLETLSIDFSNTGMNQHDFKFLLDKFATSIDGLKPKQQDLTHSHFLSTFALHFQHLKLNSEPVDLAELGFLCNCIATYLKHISKTARFMNCIVLDLGNNLINDQGSVVFREALGHLKSQFDNYFFAEQLILNLQSCGLSSAFANIIEGVNLMTFGATVNHKRTLNRLSLQMDNNNEFDAFESLSKFLMNLIAIHKVNQVQLQHLDINLHGTQILPIKIEDFQQFLYKTAQIPTTHSCLLETFKLDIGNCSLPEDSFISILQGLKALQPFINNEFNQVSTFNNVLLDFQGASLNSNEATTLAQVIDMLVSSSMGNKNVLNELVLGLSEIKSDENDMKNIVVSLLKLNQPRLPIQSALIHFNDNRGDFSKQVLNLQKTINKSRTDV